MGLTRDDVAAALRGLAATGESSDAGRAGSSPTPREEPSSSGILPAQELLRWSAVCDTFVSVKLDAPAGADRARLEAIAREAEARLRDRASAPADGAPVALTSIITEFVDAGGTVVHTARWGPGLSGQTPKAAPAEVRGGSGGGHRPIQIAGATPPASAPSPGTGSTAPTPQQGATALPGVARIIAVGAGKGGVGKSTIAVNLAVGLARRGRAVGLLDGDIYGPSFPTMLGLDALEQATLGGKLQPFLVHGIKAITIGKLVAADKPLIWRGPMAHGAFKQLSEQTNWGELDDLIIDLPPGTGDISLTMAQVLKLTGAVVVCTPQRVAQDDAVRAARMFQQLGIEVLGVVENMSYFVGDDGKEYDIFGRGGAEHMAQRLGVPFLGAVPITMSLRKNSDEGNPSANFKGTSGAELVLARRLEALAENLEKQAALASLRGGGSRPVLTIS